MANSRELGHLIRDDIDKPKVTDFKTEVLFDPVESLCRMKQGLTAVTGNYSIQNLSSDSACIRPSSAGWLIGA